MSNFKAPLIKSLGEAGFETLDGFDGPRSTFTNTRQNGTRRVKLWFGNDVFEAGRRKQMALERRLKANYGDQYLSGYFVKGAQQWPITRSFCVVLKNS